jgi:spore coat polysaccharide biosynthesis predicted glycosyltransferase SpsG
MRCLALAQAARDRDIPVHVISRAGVDWVRERLKAGGKNFSELVGLVPKSEKPEDLLTQLSVGKKADWVVLDGYHFGLDCQNTVRNAGYKLLVIDDYAHLQEYSCDILLNQNIGAEGLVYKGDIGQKLLEPKYALLRPEFLAARRHAEERRFPEKVGNILLTLGGGDFSAHLARIASDFTVPELAGCTLRVIAGAMPEERIRVLLRDCPAKLEILDQVDDMPTFLLDTDLCVTAGGSTCWELCCLGVPFLIVEVAKNQHRVVQGLLKHHTTRLLSTDDLRTALHRRDIRRDLTVIGRRTVDGKGVWRVLDSMLQHLSIAND